MLKATVLFSSLLLTVLALPQALLRNIATANSLTFTVTELGTLSGPFSQARSINNAGQIVGEASVGSDDIDVHAFLYHDGTMTDLGTFGGMRSYAYSINNLGQITGQADLIGDLDTHAFLYADGTMHDLGALPGYESSVGSAINDHGTIVGESKVEAMIYRDGQMRGLSRRAALLANGINNAEEIVGMLENNRAYLFSHGNMKDLGTLNGREGQSFAYAINDAGQVVGASVSPDGSTTHAFVYENGGMRDLGTLYGGYSYAFAINNSGVIVGESDGAAFVYSNGVMVDLNTITPKDFGLVNLSVAWDINDSGQIVGRGFFLDKGPRAILLSPASQAE